MSISYNLKIKSANGFTTERGENLDGKRISRLVTSSIKQELAGMAGTQVVETVRQHNERVLMQAAIFFQRVVTRTPKDERYYIEKEGWHKPDDDYVWKQWKILYWRKSLSAEDIGEQYFEDESKFNDKACINAVARAIKDNLFGGEVKFNARKNRIRNIRFENVHPRFAQLEYGEYISSSGKYSKGKYHTHGVQNGYSVQAPHGMLRITQAEMQEMSITDFDKWISNYKRNTQNITRVRSKSDLKKLASLILDRTHLSDSEIDAITQIYEGGTGVDV